MNLFDLYENREPYQQAIDKLEQRRIEDLEARMDDCARRGDKEGFQKCKAERDSYHKIKETHDTTEKNSSPVAGAIVNRIMRQRPDLLTQYDPKLISAAVDEVADYVGDVDEIGSSDVSGWVNQVERMLKENPPEAFAEGGIGQDLITPQQRVQGAKSQKQTPTGKVVDTVKQAGKWLAGKGGPGKEGPTYESQKKKFKKVNEYISMGSDKNYLEAEPYKNYKIYVRKTPFGNTGIYTAHTEIDRKEFMGKGPSQEEAVQAVRDRINFVLNAQKKVTGSSTIDFNVKFATDLLADPRQTFYAKLENVNGQPKLIIAGTDIANDPELLAAGDFKRSTLRNQVDDQGRATPLPGIPLTAKSLRAGDWIANGRYTVGNEATDSDGNRVFDLTYHSTAHTKSDKLRLNQPAFTLGTAREVDEADGKQDNKQVDIKASMLLKRARAAHPLAQSDAEALAMYFLEKEESDVDRLDQVNDREDRMIDRLNQVEQELQQQIDKLQGHDKSGMAEGLWGGSGPGGLLTPYAVYTKQNGQVKRVKSTNKIGRPMNPREAEAYVAAMRKRDPARWTHDTVWIAPADIDLDEEQKPLGFGEFPPKQEIKIDPPRKLKSGQTYQDQNKYWQSQGQAPIYKTNEAGSPAQQAAIAIAMKRAGKKPKNMAEGSYTKEIQSQGITDAKLLKAAARIDRLAESFK